MKLESEIIRLIWIWIRLTSIYVQFPKLPASSQYEKTFRSTIREDMITQLHNFIKVREDLIKHPQIDKVDKYLEPSWKPIVELQEGIRQLRNQYIAHIQEENRQFKKPIQELVEEQDVPTLYGEWLFRIGCCIVYCKGIAANFSTEWDNALIKYQNSQPFPSKKGTIKIKTVPIKVQEISDIVSKNLTNNNLRGF